MGQYLNLATGAPASPVNLNNSFEPLGYAADGSLTTVTASASAHVKGSYTIIGTTANAWAGFWLIIGKGANANARFLIDVSIDGGTSVKCPNIYAESGAAGTAANTFSVFLPINVPAASDVRVKMQCHSSGSVATGIAVRGVIRNDDSPPCFDTMVAPVADTTNSRASTVSQGFASTATWTEQIASTANTYGAMLMIPGRSTVDPSVNQDATFVLATGASSSEVEFWRQTSASLGASTYYRPADAQLIARSIPSGTRISASPLVPTPGTMTVCLGLYGFY